MTVDKTGVEETVADKTGGDELGINPIFLFRRLCQTTIT